jgi:prepilin-type N-terminal cleavage/methylation domain-containing protein
MRTRWNRVRKNRCTAFTLIELLVVVLILGILLAVAIPLYLSSVKNSATQMVKGNLRTIGQAALAYKMKNNTYPSALGDVVGADKDLQVAPRGPRGVTYFLAGSIVTAIEGAIQTPRGRNRGEDIFGGTGTSDRATFNVATGEYTNL